MAGLFREGTLERVPVTEVLLSSLVRAELQGPFLLVQLPQIQGPPQDQLEMLLQLQLRLCLWFLTPRTVARLLREPAAILVGQVAEEQT